MSQERSGPQINRQIVEEAAAWFVEINEDEADLETRQRFHAWLTASPEHVRAYLRILPDWEDGEQVNGVAAGVSPDTADPESLIAWARKSTNVVSLASPPAPPASSAGQLRSSQRISRNRLRLRWISVAAAASVLAALGTIWLLAWQSPYVTSIGEQRFIALDDGTTVELNARSRLQVRFSDTERLVKLIEGQALFNVAKDPARAFVVQSGATTVRAVGTQFDVYRKSSGTVVTVIEGKVTVSGKSVRSERDDATSRTVARDETPGGISAPVLLTAGEQITVTPSQISQAKPADVGLATAWTKRRLAFFRTPLPEVAEEFNRYNKRQLTIKDERLATFNVSGTFSSTDPAALIRFLRVQPGIEITETAAEIEISSTAAPVTAP